jgi:hypothetical protein
MKQAGWDTHFVAGAQGRHVGGASARTRNDVPVLEGVLFLEALRSPGLYFRKHRGAGPYLAYRAILCGAMALRWVRWTLVPRATGQSASRRRLFRRALAWVLAGCPAGMLP